MAAFDIQQHFKGLRVGHRKSRADPFATGFEDESDDEKSRPSRSKKKTRASPIPDSSTATSRPNDSDDDSLAPPARFDRRPSPAPTSLPTTRVTDGAGRRGSVDHRLEQHRPVRSAVAQAAGTLAYLDDSDDQEELLRPPRRQQRSTSPALRTRERSVSDAAADSIARGSPPKPSSLLPPPVQPSRHTVASPFAGTKYLEDSSDSDEEAVASRTNSTDDTNNPAPATTTVDSAPRAESPSSRRFEVTRTDKPPVQHGGGVSWRAFSAGRAEQRNSEIEALQASFRQRGRTIAFSPHALTDDGQRVPIAAASETACAATSALAARPARAGGKLRGKSPPRRASDVGSHEDDELSDGGSVGIYDPAQFKTNPFTGMHIIRRSRQANRFDELALAANPMASETSGSFGVSRPTASPTSPSMTSPSSSDHDHRSPDSPSERSAMTDSIHSIASLTMISPPETIPEGQYVEHGTSPVSSTIDFPDSLSRNASVRSLLMGTSRPMRIPPSRRSSRRSTSAQASLSPAHAFLSTWSNHDLRTTEPTPDPQPDDEGQAIGINNEYIIGRQISHGGFSVVKEVHTIDDAGRNRVRAVKIVRKAIDPAGLHPDGDLDNDKCQADLEHEISVWRHLKHRHILDLLAVYETDFATFCVMDLNVGGTLFDAVRRSRVSAAAAAQVDPAGSGARNRGLDPVLARAYSHQLASALRYLHEDIKVVHRDVKLENCLIDLSQPDATTGAGTLRLCDFGLADFLHSAGSSSSITPSPSRDSLATLQHLQPRFAPSSLIGTLEYASPKGLSVHRKLFETAGDVWAFGVIVYALCTGELPFRHPMPAKTVELILSAEWDETCLANSPAAAAATTAGGGGGGGGYTPTAADGEDEIMHSPPPPPETGPPDDAANHGSAAAAAAPVVELVRGCLTRDLHARWSISECMASPWFAGLASGEDGEDDGGRRRDERVERMRWR